jgi:hypothetical protein
MGENANGIGHIKDTRLDPAELLMVTRHRSRAWNKTLKFRQVGQHGIRLVSRWHQLAFLLIQRVPVERREQRCGKCGNSGHNARTC